VKSGVVELEMAFLDVKGTTLRCGRVVGDGAVMEDGWRLVVDCGEDAGERGLVGVEDTVVGGYGAVFGVVNHAGYCCGGGGGSCDWFWGQGYCFR